MLHVRFAFLGYKKSGDSEMIFVIPPSPDFQSPIDPSDLDVEAELHQVQITNS
jgi:UDP-N-acetylglucosamine enolpyruvyl transferase